MPTINQLRLSDATVQVGPDLVTLEGAGEDKFTFGPAGDVGSAISGIDGDVTLVLRRQNLWMLSLTLIQASPAVTTLLGLYALQMAFPISVKYGEFTFQGFAFFANLGEVAASLGTTTRTITLNCAYQSGNINAAPGTALPIA